MWKSCIQKRNKGFTLFQEQKVWKKMYSEKNWPLIPNVTCNHSFGFKEDANVYRFGVYTTFKIINTMHHKFYECEDIVLICNKLLEIRF